MNTVHSYSERTQQESIRKRLASRDNGFVCFTFTDDDTIPGMFDEQVARHAHKSAIIDSDRSVTYEELARLANDVGHALIRANPSFRAPVALLIARPSSFVPAMLGVLRAGGFYVPLDPLFPEDCNARILEACRARCILTERAHYPLAQCLARAGQVVICVDEIHHEFLEVVDRSAPKDPACIIFSSAATGRPKGTVQTHQTILAVVQRYTNSLFAGFQDRVSLLSSSSVTASIGTIFGALLNGATLCGFSVREHGVSALADWLDSERITIYRSISSMFRNLSWCVSSDRVFATVQVVCLGDTLFKSDLDLFTRHFPCGCALVNFYGCSELSSAACFYMDAASQLADGVLPVGFPLEGIAISVATGNGLVNWVSGDPHPKTAPTDLGEIALKSRNLSPGYWNDAEATARSFALVDWQRDGWRTFRTGDWGIMRAEDGLIHLGREDEQVKQSGVRNAAVTIHRPEASDESARDI